MSLNSFKDMYLLGMANILRQLDQRNSVVNYERPSLRSTPRVRIRTGHNIILAGRMTREARRGIDVDVNTLRKAEGRKDKYAHSKARAKL